MSVTFNPFISKSGFKSGDFEVNTSGDLVARDISATNMVANTIDATSIKINGVPIFANEDSTTAFQIDKDFIVSEGSTPYLSVINGQITINNRSDSVGRIDNVDIGSITPGTGTFTSINTGVLGIPVIESNTNLDLSVSNAIVFRVNNVNKGRIDASGINVPIVDTSINNTSIGLLVPAVASFISATTTEIPTTPLSVTNKSYVDTQISAFAIAFGI